METKTEYQKINTLFKRDSNNVIMPDAWADPMFEYLANTKWEATEKVDGTNIRIIITPPATEGAPVGVEFRGSVSDWELLSLSKSPIVEVVIKEEAAAA